MRLFLCLILVCLFLQSLTEEESGCMNECEAISAHGITAHVAFN